jgi:hypothetical protein
MDTNPYESPKTDSPKSEPEPPAKGLTAPELFGVVARGIGLWFLASATYNLAVYLIPHQTRLEQSNYAIYALEYAVAGVIPFFAPNFLVNLTYRKRRLD